MYDLDFYTKKGPCLGCEKRYPCCHSKCDDYKKWYSECISKKIQIRQAKHNNKMFAEYVARAKDNFKKDNRLHGCKMRRHINGK